MLFHGNPPLFGCVFQYEQSVGFSLIRRAWEKPFGGCSCQLAPIIALGFRTQLSSAPQMARATPSLTQAAFTSYTGSLLLSLYAPRYCLTASAGFGRQFTKLRALSRLRRRYDSRKYRFPRFFCPFQPFPQRGGAGQAIAGVLGGAIRLGMMYRMEWLAAIVCQFRLPLR